jgi:hypothetical protein
VVTGDVSQIDLPRGMPGLVDAERVLAKVKGIAMTRFTAPTWCATRWWPASSRPTTRAPSARRRSLSHERTPACPCSSPMRATARSCRATRSSAASAALACRAR